jgi:hypothetical protein
LVPVFAGGLMAGGVLLIGRDMIVGRSSQKNDPYQIYKDLGFLVALAAISLGAGAAGAFASSKLLG